MQPSQLVEGCILLKDVQGKSGRPIVKKNTVLTSEHITILQKFLVESVEVSSKMADGKTYRPGSRKYTEKEFKKIITVARPTKITSFTAHYLQVVTQFKEAFIQWNNGVPIDISKTRNFIIPLLERIDEQGIEVFTLHQYVEAKEYIYYHSVALSVIAAFIGKKLGFEKGEWLQIGLAGLLSDVGMTRIDPDIITKGEFLLEKQEQDLKNHPTYSSRMVENLPAVTSAVKLAILQHHERMDGSGYPLGLTQGKINQYARVLAVADTYHAMTSERIYKKRQSVFKAIGELYNQQFAKFDARVVKAFIKSFANHALGKNVQLSNGETGEIAFIDEEQPTMPFIKLDTTSKVISMQENPQLAIEDFIID